MTENLQLIRDYEGQIALYKLRIEHLEVEEKRLNQHIRMLTADPQRMLEQMQIAGFPALDVKAIYELLDEWRKAGGTQRLIDWWRHERSQRDAYVLAADHKEEG